MDTQIILIYCLCDDLLRGMQHKEDVQCQMSDAEVMTMALVSPRQSRDSRLRASPLASPA